VLRHFDRVNIIKRVKIDGQWRYASVVEQGGEIVPDVVWVRGVVESHPEGSYTLDWYENGRRRHQSIGILRHAYEAARAKLRSKGSPSVADGQLTISAAVERYLDRSKLAAAIPPFSLIAPS